MGRVITSNDAAETWSPEVAEHREQAYSNGYDDAIDEVKELLERRLETVDAKGMDGEVWIVRALLDDVQRLAEAEGA